MAEQERGIRAQRQQRRAEQGSAARYRAVDLHHQRRIAPRAHRLAIQRVIAVARRHLLERQVAVAQGRQRADCDDRIDIVMRVGHAAAKRGVRLLFHQPQTVAGQRLRRAIDLDIEPRQLSHHQMIGQPRQEALIVRCREAMAIDQPGFEFKSDPGAALCEKRPRRSWSISRAVSSWRRATNARWSASVKPAAPISWPDRPAPCPVCPPS
ncbi:hypothetical protein [Qipengyuania sp. YIM B01966]|uniref:hypothetical protein n=1 Tax=Qipengyuania sp. YIM B01966 TaxID=2778646 RepID=UPI0018F63ECF|nr:hypothetical protein [Qipengyuania sp. YIM B01966]